MNSPAEKAGLIAEDDYVIASPDLLLRSEDEFYQLITQNTRRQVKLVVFSAKTEELREIVIVPDFDWGGEGCLGCDVGSGMIHWIPKKAVTLNAEKQQGQVQGQVQKQDLPVPPSLQGPSAHQTTTTPTPAIANPQYQQPLPSQYQQPLFGGSPAKASQIPQVNVSVPSARPVVNLSSEQSQQQTSSVTQAIFPESFPAPTLAPPPMSTYHHQPHNQPHPQQTYNQPSTVIDDIPMPNFTVPSDIINQK